MKDLERFYMVEWSKIPPNVFSNLIKHDRNRLSAVILARGGCTKYINRGDNNCETYFFKLNL